MTDLEHLVEQAVRRILAENDVPKRIGPELIAQRYDISERLAGEWIRAMKAAGVVASIGNVAVAKLSACDAWVVSGGKEKRRERKRSLRAVDGGAA